MEVFAIEPFKSMLDLLLFIGLVIVAFVVLVPVIVLFRRFLAWWIELWDDWIG